MSFRSLVAYALSFLERASLLLGIVLLTKVLLYDMPQVVGLNFVDYKEDGSLGVWLVSPSLVKTPVEALVAIGCLWSNKRLRDKRQKQARDR